MKRLFLSIIFLLISAAVFGQDNMSYADKAASLQKEIWGAPTPEFKQTTVPANLSNEGAVVIARSYNLQESSTGKFKFAIITAAVVKHVVKVSVFHERVKINDKVALEAYSTVEYQKILDNTTHFLSAKLVNTNNTFIGAKIIKANGKETIVNTSEEVLLKNDTKDQKGKLAIPGLEVGDILDYYVSHASVDETADGDSFADNDQLFVFADEYPVLYYSIDFQFSKKVVVQYIYANGAPHFQLSTNDAGDQLLSLKLHDIPKYQNQQWTSPLRQYPYIEIGSQTYNGNFVQSNRLEDIKTFFLSGFGEYAGYDVLAKNVKDHFKSSREYKNAPIDSVAKLLYDEWRYKIFCNYRGDELEHIEDMNYRSWRVDLSVRMIAMQLTDLKIDYDILMVASRNSNSLDNVFLIGDLTYMIRINGTKPLYMAFEDPTTLFNEIPQRFQGEKVIVLSPTRHSGQHYTFTEGTAILPVISADENNIDTRLQISLVPGNMQKLKVERLIKETGALRHDDQRSLLPAQMVDDQLRALVNGDPLEKRLSKNDATRKMKSDYIDAFQKQLQDINKPFTAEIKEEFNQDPEHVENCKIISSGLSADDPAFKFSSSFVLNNLVKKAGDNYIIDAGKLTGDFYKLDADDRKRNVDVYMPCARSFNYTITIAIPPGYDVKGVEEMTVNNVNKTGKFSSSVTVKGNEVTIAVSRVYNNNFEKSADWPLIVDLIDAASNFNTQKLLFEKK